ncbi:MAG: hypothetical protein KJO07_05255 [Deltaproteobacteria bacterium]|jgi:tetratricopeptide (TPR) repeat protein|nr:hypothetical protein [Deltaproteobacteria bacterium]
MPTRLAIAVFLVSLSAAAPTALAQAPQAQARVEYQKGETAYATGDFETAIVHYKKAYELSKKPALLFNIAQAYKVKRDYRNAIYFYETYLRLEESPSNQADVERYIKNLKAQMAADRKRAEDERRLEQERKRAKAAKEKAEAEQRRLEAEAKARQAREREVLAQAELARAQGGPLREPNPKLKLAGWVTGGVGLATLGAGIVFNLRASSKFDDVNSAEKWSAELDDTLDTAEGSRTLGIVLSSVGGAALVTGGILYYLGHRGRVVETPAVTLSPTEGGMRIGFGGRF